MTFTRYSPFTRYGHFTCFPTYCISSKRSVPYIKTFSTLSRVRILPQLDILCTSAVKRYHAKNDKSPLVSPVFPCNEVHASKKKLPSSSLNLSLVIPYSGELCNKNRIDNTSETLTAWNTSYYTAGSGKWEAIKGAPDQLLKRAAMVFRVQSRHVELLLTYWCSIIISNDC